VNKHAAWSIESCLCFFGIFCLRIAFLYDIYHDKSHCQLTLRKQEERTLSEDGENQGEGQCTGITFFLEGGKLKPGYGVFLFSFPGMG
jgi:hypothetical protein